MLAAAAPPGAGGEEGGPLLPPRAAPGRPSRRPGPAAHACAAALLCFLPLAARLRPSSGAPAAAGAGEPQGAPPPLRAAEVRLLESGRGALAPTTTFPPWRHLLGTTTTRTGTTTTTTPAPLGASKAQPAGAPASDGGAARASAGADAGPAGPAHDEAPATSTAQPQAATTAEQPPAQPPRASAAAGAAALPEAAAETTAEPGPPTTTEAAEPEEQPLASPASLFCFSLVVPWTDEGALLELQQRRGVGIFACDGTAVYSNPGGRHGELDTRLVDIDLHCERGGLWNTMMNTPIFAKLWNTVVQDGQFKAHAWTAKTDPDTVFLPDVLKSILQSPDYPLDRAQENKGQFLNGCFIGLHGPLEVLSRRALEVYGEGNEECGQPVEEDVYIRGCLQFLGVFQQDQFDILDERDCARDGNFQSPDWHDCASGHAAFHPFKTPEEYGDCLDRAGR